MRGIIMSGIKARLVVVSVAALLIIFGIAQLRNMQLGVYPEFTPVYVEVQTEALGLSAEEIEEILTVALEQDLLNGIAYLDEIWSESMPGLSRVVCVFEPGTDPMVARQVVAERLTQAHALPNVSKPPIMLQPYSSASRVMKVGLTPASQDMSLIDLSVLARWTIQPYLTGVEGVANVSIWGQRKRQLQVQVNPETLSEKGVALHDVIKTTGEALWVSPLTYLNSSTPGTGGFFDTPNQRLGIRHVLPISNAEELGQVSVFGHKDMVLEDIASVVENHQPLIGDAIVNGNPGLMLVIEKFPWASTVKVTEAVEDALEKLAPGLTGVTFDTEIFMPANFIEASFINLTSALSISLVLIIAMLFLFFYEWRAALISLVSIILSLVAGAYVLFLQGAIFNVMVLAGLIVGLGIIIDDAISTVANIRSHLQQAREAGADKTTAGIILEAVREIRNPVFFGTVILVLAALPFFFLTGTRGAFLSAMSYSYLLAIAASALVALIVTPALSFILYAHASPAKREAPFLAALKNGFSSAATVFIQRPAMSYLTLAVIAIVGVASMSMLNRGLQYPEPRERDLAITWEAPYGTSHPQMSKVTGDAVSKLRTIPGITNVAAHIGRAILSDKIVNVHSGEIWISMDDDADYDKTLAAVWQVLDGYPDMNSDVMTYHQQTLRRNLSGTGGKMYAVRVYGENPEVLKQKTEEVQKVVSNVNGVTDAYVDYPPTEPTIEIEVDLDKAKEYGIKPGDVRRTAATLLAGIEVGNLFEGQKVFEVVVWGVPEVRNSINSVRNLLVDIPGGGHVRVADVADVRERPNPAVIRREKVSQYMDVNFNVPTGNFSAIANDIERSLSQVDFPLEYHAELVGDYAKIQEGRSQMWGIVIAVIIGIFLLMQAAFWSWRLTLVVLPSLLLGLSGGVLVALLSGGSLSMAVLAGLLAVFGLTTYQGVMLIKHFTNLEMEGVAFGPGLATRGVEGRVSAILMSSIITALAILPFAFYGNAPGMAMLAPMAVVMLGGLVTSLMVNLLVLPNLFLAFGKVSEEVMEEEKSIIDLEVASPV
ncbi:MAG: efflux RND transporter permease subunit [Lewinellaceae bacterium]|nr:efflux RND transporter permease subunit [Lewinellaceae bacterium]